MQPCPRACASGGDTDQCRSRRAATCGNVTAPSSSTQRHLKVAGAPHVAAVDVQLRDCYQAVAACQHGFAPVRLHGQVELVVGPRGREGASTGGGGWRAAAAVAGGTAAAGAAALHPKPGARLGKLHRCARLCMDDALSCSCLECSQRSVCFAPPPSILQEAGRRRQCAPRHISHASRPAGT